ncbi:hypothetical protein KC19_11G079300 [Ceratodon purpureus]|uniref:Uncharacterized protein n=1 Tax=Ceratodon purpureus TaxID=3225 RepID=A0A8T0GCI8_CERPU|nr:hypothetical protein KC19_11G079300 [Ceratodon purpureus]
MLAYIGLVCNHLVASLTAVILLSRKCQNGWTSPGTLTERDLGAHLDTWDFVFIAMGKRPICVNTKNGAEACKMRH